MSDEREYEEVFEFKAKIQVSVSYNLGLERKTAIRTLITNVRVEADASSAMAIAAEKAKQQAQGYDTSSPLLVTELALPINASHITLRVIPDEDIELVPMES